MNAFKLLMAASCFLGLATSGVAKQDYSKSEGLLQYVDPYIGSGFHGHVFVGTSVPYGMVQLGPNNIHKGWDWCSGYHYSDSILIGFSHTHLSGTGCTDLGDILIMPLNEIRTPRGNQDDIRDGYASKYSHDNEIARPEYYSLILDRYNIKAELTATDRVGFHRYTYPKTELANLIFDIGNKQGESGEVKDAEVQYFEDGRVEGYVITSPVYVNIYQKGADVRMYFSAVLNKKPVQVGTFVKDVVNPGKHQEKGPGAGLYMTFSTEEQEAVEVKVGLSYTSIENARFNRETEAADVTFDQAKKNATDVWNESLSRIYVEGGKETDKVKFYTGLFHALLGRGLASDANGYYPKNNGTVGRIALDEEGNPVHQHYNTDAIWGGFWNLTQLWSLAYPEYYSDWIKSQLLVYQDAGWLGDGIACSKYVSGVGTNFTSLAIAAAYNCGIRDFDVQQGYEAALKNEVEWRGRLEGAGKMDVRQFVERGYSPYEKRFDMVTREEGSGFGASHTMEYSFSSFAVSQFAKHLGKEDDYKLLSDLSNGWKNLYDPETRLIRPKDTKGNFLEDFNPLAPWKGFQEGNAVQYTFYVPHQIDELVDLVGQETFNNRLDSIFLLSQKNIFGGGKEVDAFAGLKTVYNHGNQPNLHISWLFNFSGKPYLSQKWVRAILDEFYGLEGIHGYGYGQDEDQGQLGAWYVMSALGLFDVKGLTEIDPKFQIGAPLFDKVTVRLNKDYYPGEKFVIEAKKQAVGDCYLQDISLNNRPQDTVQLPFSEVVKGGKLVLGLGASPNEELTH